MTNKNDLGVERQIKEICISYPKSDLKEHDGQPYYSVKYIENGEEYEGYGTYKIEVFMEYLRNYFMPSVTLQEPKTGHWIITYPHGKQNPIYECPRCHASNSSVFKNYCPNCGAKMIEL